MPSYRIAVIIACIDQSYQNSVLRGIADSAKECSLSIEVFVSFTGTMGNLGHDTGEFNIFRLPDFKEFDGAILLTNTVAYQPVISDILSRIKAAGIPAVSIDNDIPSFYHIGIDNRTAMRRITDHMIMFHGVKTINYISGPRDNPESIDRLAGFMDVLRENDIPIEEERIFYGDFRAPTGRQAVEQFLASSLDMPEAIICANDVMAASAITRLAEAGLLVPADIAVTGFDNTYSSHSFQVELTSVDRPLGHSGKLACKMLMNHFQALEQKRSIMLDMSPHFTESCGCSDKAVYDLVEFKELNYHNYMKFEKVESYMGQFNKLSCELLSCNTFSEYIGVLKSFVKGIDPGEFYFCLCDGWDSSPSASFPAGPPSEDEIPTHYTDTVTVAIAYKDGSFAEPSVMRTKDILPAFSENRTPGKMYYIIPLHFGVRCLGYMVIYNSPVSIYNSMFETFCINISNSLENIRKLVCLESAVEHLGKLYAQDTFCGIFNRNGFVQATRDVYADCVREQRDIMLMFIDLDGLKKINDTFGHDIGDEAIVCIADVLRRTCTNGEIFCRFGGDEFIVFKADSSTAEADELTRSINSCINDLNLSGDHEFELSASTGYVITVPKEGEDIFRFVTEADKIMYVQKRKKKLSKYLKS
ncbi:MAG: GGDEF domain-containing protein [Ruminococcus sp.]|nr:GGDEF domain-containing protein [Ruminococcus sp.]